MYKTRLAVESDVEQIRDVYVATYGADYAYPQYYDVALLKRMVFADDTLLFVAEETSTNRIVGAEGVVG